MEVIEGVNDFLINESKVKDVKPLINAVTDVVSKWSLQEKKKFFHCFLTQAFVTSSDVECVQTFENAKYDKKKQVNSSRLAKINEMLPYMKKLYKGLEEFFANSSFQGVSWSTLISLFQASLLKVNSTHLGRPVPDLEVLYSKVYLSCVHPTEAIKECMYRLKGLNELKAKLPSTFQLPAGNKDGIAEVCKRVTLTDEIRALAKVVVCLNPFHLKHNQIYNQSRGTEEAKIFEVSVLQMWNEDYCKAFKSLTGEAGVTMYSFDVKDNDPFWRCYNTLKWFCGEMRTYVGGGVKSGKIKINRKYSEKEMTVTNSDIEKLQKWSVKT